MKSLYENILSKSNVGILPRVINNLTYCNDVKEFGKLWTMLKLDIDGCYWDYVEGSGYIYKNLIENLIFCMPTNDPKKYSCMFIYDDPKKWPEKFDVKKYVKLVSKTLDMTYDYRNDGGWYNLKFK